MTIARTRAVKLLVSRVVLEVVGLQAVMQPGPVDGLAAGVRAAVLAEPAIGKPCSPFFQSLREDPLSRPVPSQKLRALPWKFEIQRSRAASREGDLAVESRCLCC